jgi:hypothetical protein
MSGLALLLSLALLQTAAPATDVAGLVEDARTLTSARTNEARFEALTALLRARSLAFTVEPFTIAKPIGSEPRTEGRNVVVTIGEGPEEILVGAHYDAVRLQDGTLSQGAVDNAASSVILVRVAQALQQKLPAMRVRIVWFDMEELGLVGSAKYVESRGSDRPVAMLNFDINGYGDTVLFGPHLPRNQGIREALGRACLEQRRECLLLPQMPPGDDRSFTKADVPTISIAVLPALEAHQVWLLMNSKESGLAQGFLPAVLRTIHTPDDVPAKLQAETMTEMVQFAVSLVHAVTAQRR